MASSDSHFVTTAEETCTLGTAAVAPLLSSQRSYIHRPRFIVLMGVSGTGKSTLGYALSKRMRLPFIDGDDLHPAANVAKMARGAALDDADRLPWLETIRSTAVARVREQVRAGGERVREARPGVELAGNLKAGSASDDRCGEGASVRTRDAPEAWRPGVIVACSALKRAYRALLRGEEALATYFVYLKGDREVLRARMLQREGHFMKAGMLESQLETLESPEGEPGVVTVSVEMSTEEQVQRVVDTFRALSRAV